MSLALWNAVLIGARLLQFAAALTLFGSALFYLYGFERDLPTPATFMRRAWPQALLFVAAVAALLGVVLWVMAETVSFSEEPEDAFNIAKLWMIFSETSFGRVCLLRSGLLVLSLLASLYIPRVRSLWITQAILGGLVLMSFAWTGHGAMDKGAPGAVHLAADLLHLLAAGVWLGALLPLAMLMLRALHSQSMNAARASHYGLVKFSEMGVGVVLALVLSGIINSWFLIGLANWKALFTTAYGLALSAKLVLFALMLVFAAAHRFWLTPALQVKIEKESSPSAVLRRLRTGVLIEAGLAVLVLIAVAVLGSLAPPIAGE